VPLRFQVPKSAFLVKILMSRWGKIILASLTLLLCGGIMTFTYFYVTYANLIDEKLKAGPFPATSALYAAPRTIMVGDEGSGPEIATILRKAGYSENNHNSLGWYQLRADGIEIYPEAESYFKREGAVIKFTDGKVSEITALKDNSGVSLYAIEPELMTSLFDEKREKRRIVKFENIPKVVVNAVISAEDKRFFEHSGFDPFGIMRAFWVDVRERRRAQGASTLSMQVARTLWLSNRRTVDRKLAEVLITMHIEQKLTKEQIFEYYANGIYLGQHGSFSIHGFAEAAQVFLGKDLSQLDAGEAALLAGLPQVPIQGNPIQHPERAKQRRNQVLGLMRDNGYLQPKEYEELIERPIRTMADDSKTADANYFVDLINDQLGQKLGQDYQGKPYRIYTTLDVELQQDANTAVQKALVEVDVAMKKRFKDYGTPKLPVAQVALIAIDPQTAEVRAMVGGRNYGLTQLNRVLARRQPGSSFKPFVYATALNSALTGQEPIITPLTTYEDEPTTFKVDGRPAYTPTDFHSAYYGKVTVRQALARSLNIPTIKIALQVGLRKVVNLARQAGMNADLRATPALALGAYDVTPLEVAGAYTIFSNRGVYVEPSMIREIRGPDGETAFDHVPKRRQVLDARIAYMMTNLMQEVMRSGTGAGTRSRGFWQPAAGKTGSSRDGWFAGYTSKLLCVVWVGFDDGTDIGLEGARTALPIWAEFMKAAHKHRTYRNVSEFMAPDGIVSAEIDPTTGLLASNGCPTHKTEVFIAGTQPVEVCKFHGGGQAGTQVSTWDAGPATAAAPRPAPTPQGPEIGGAGSRSPSVTPEKPKHEKKVRSIPVTPPSPGEQPKPTDQSNQEPSDKKGLLEKLWGVIKK
jgi:penicillin-binding protein 1B